MTLMLDRRQMVMVGMLGSGAFAVPGFARALQAGAAGGFTHGVASGEPRQRSVLLWTRFLPATGDIARVRVELSEDEAFARIAGGAEMVTGPWRDHTVKLMVAGLAPGTRYFYRFVAGDGTVSRIGRTATLSEDPKHVSVAYFSCSNLPFGFFNAYAHAAARDDIDLAFHLGDYLYEYAPGGYPPAAQSIAGRAAFLPDREIVALADYRLRFQAYRSDPDLQALHQLKPMLCLWDDHESANDAWEGGAGNHQPEEGDWSVRKAASIQAYREWMPVSDEPWASYDLGGLATIFRTETRLLARSRQAKPSPEMLADPQQVRALEEAWRDDAATMMGTAQERWLADAMATSVKRGAKWQLVGFGTNMGRMISPPRLEDLLPVAAPERNRGYVATGAALGKAGLPFNLDNWNGYPAARARFLKGALEAEANTVLISGDSHNTWAFDIAQDGTPAAVEFGGTSVTSGGMEGSFPGIDPARVARALVAGNPELKWCDASRRGYGVLTLTPETAVNEFVFMATVRERTIRTSPGHRVMVPHGARRMVAA